MNAFENTRYSRQILLKEFGPMAQEKLLNAKILVVGAGGLGCPCLQYLCAAGIGTLGVVDLDQVELSNLHRQILFTNEDIGKNKAQTAREKLLAMNPEISITAYPEHLDTANAIQIISDYDLVIDGSDNYPTRYLVNDACVILNKPLIYGAILRFEGQVGLLNVPALNETLACNYRDVFPNPPSEAFSCRHTGVLGVLPGIIGTLQATEALKFLCGIGETLAGKIFTLNLKTYNNYTLQLSKAKLTDSKFPQNETEFKSFDYQAFCNNHKSGNEMEAAEFESFLKNEKLLIIDVREVGELPHVRAFKTLNIPLKQLEQKLHEDWLSQKVVLICNSGQRSAEAYQKIKDRFKPASLYNLKGGLQSLSKV